MKKNQEAYLNCSFCLGCPATTTPSSWWPLLLRRVLLPSRTVHLSRSPSPRPSPSLPPLCCLLPAHVDSHAVSIASFLPGGFCVSMDLLTGCCGFWLGITQTCALSSSHCGSLGHFSEFNIISYKSTKGWMQLSYPNPFPKPWLPRDPSQPELPNKMQET